ncbi:GDP-Man:Man3GlcNAc2-PP-dolichol alpha-1,2-mannosyltransferase [Chytriomyces confervae]|uniref:GDP-Man:Man(3)GlcNAc(2)-PP-Dol alpha-1,2-mannosyltransferase n=1 Tax=Chytriomyces confervae TaxID=246404 RepID=A0A507FQP6_9FUNG|nr:GDP-Man:Man3GlcNAc2-PP-dolichol alpha-1,2-mannosyltransferase [Chytriomyces confervae]
MTSVAIVLAVGIAATLATFLFVTRRRSQSPTVAFFHPFWYGFNTYIPIHLSRPPQRNSLTIAQSDGGGGGERVLWAAVSALLARESKSAIKFNVVIYSKTGLSLDTVLQKVKSQFGIVFSKDQKSRISFVELTYWRYLEAERYPRLTLVAQSIASAFVAAEALIKHPPPEIFVDTIGFAFTLPIAKLLGCRKVLAYVHYPTISSDMINVVKDGVESYNNRGRVATSPFVRNLKLCYYRLFAMLYSFVGSYADVILANSSWTIAHLNSIWKLESRSKVVFPPCETKSLTDFSLKNRERVILSVAQFSGPKKLRLLFIGGARHAADKALADSVLEYATRLGIRGNVDILVNAPFPDLQAWLGKASLGLHAMRDEHFGIGIVEYMAAGVIPIANNSGGPKMDIVSTSNRESRTGYLASSKEEYAAAIWDALNLSADEEFDMRTRARSSVATRFSTATFQTEFLRSIDPLMDGAFSKRR